MEILGSSFLLRPWRYGDEVSLVKHADNRKIWMNLTDAFPHPYTIAHARRWIGLCQDEPRRSSMFAIEIEGEAAGGIGFERLTGIHRMTAQIGYWVGESHWGKGIATEALRLVSRYAFAEYPFVRLQAEVFEWNLASARVLQKAGYTEEARMRRNCIKDGRIIDEIIYALIK